MSRKLPICLLLSKPCDVSSRCGKLLRAVGSPNFLNYNLNLSTLRKSHLGQTTLFLQDGSSIQELPLVVRNLHDNDIDMVCENNKVNELKIVKITSDIEDFEEKEMVAGFERCYSSKGVFKLLELIPAAEVTPDVAVQALKSIFRLENNHEFRNIKGWEIEEKNENFTRSAVISNLASVVSRAENSEVLLEGLLAVSRDVTSGKKPPYRDVLCNEVLLRVADGKLSLPKVCVAIRAFALIDKKDHADKLWSGILENEKQIDRHNIMEVFRTLPYLRQSRRLVFSVAEKKLGTLWVELQGKDVAEILEILNSTNCLTERVVRLISGWLSTNIHRVSEPDLLLILSGFRKSPSSEQGVEKALERFVKAKGLRVVNPALFAGIMDYCKQFKIRSPLILDGCSEYLRLRRKELAPSQLSSLFTPFGTLDYHPKAGTAFWQVFEEELLDRFVQLHPGDALDVMLSCVYLEKYPLNFIQKVFNPYFLDRLHSVQPPSLLTVLRRKLKVLDTALTLECSSYRGPLLPRDHSAKSLYQDGRIRRASSILSSALQGCVDGFMSSLVVLGQLPLTELYVVDVLIHPKPLETAYLNFVEPGTSTAVLIRVPEHSDSACQHLLGSQVMRRRHFRAIGLSIVELELNKLLGLRYHPKKVIAYFNEQLEQAIPSTGTLA